MMELLFLVFYIVSPKKNHWIFAFLKQNFLIFSLLTSSRCRQLAANHLRINLTSRLLSGRRSMSGESALEVQLKVQSKVQLSKKL